MLQKSLTTTPGVQKNQFHYRTEQKRYSIPECVH
uniref:Uncharacterized protein n=1 Tax=Myoviridae sp. ctaUM17 TaxID=2825133 RepID=A0A8S5TWG2_9CAUD|nr:MAG TPA: hypothetical protein [Myoviridae sp. ctaUM17]